MSYGTRLSGPPRPLAQRCCPDGDDDRDCPAHRRRLTALPVQAPGPEPGRDAHRCPPGDGDPTLVRPERRD